MIFLNLTLPPFAREADVKWWLWRALRNLNSWFVLTLVENEKNSLAVGESFLFLSPETLTISISCWKSKMKVKF